MSRRGAVAFSVGVLAVGLPADALLIWSLTPKGNLYPIAFGVYLAVLLQIAPVAALWHLRRNAMQAESLVAIQVIAAVIALLLDAALLWTWFRYYH